MPMNLRVMSGSVALVVCGKREPKDEREPSGWWFGFILIEGKF